MCFCWLSQEWLSDCFGMCEEASHGPIYIDDTSLPRSHEKMRVPSDTDISPCTMPSLSNVSSQNKSQDAQIPLLTPITGDIIELHRDDALDGHHGVGDSELTNLESIYTAPSHEAHTRQDYFRHQISMNAAARSPSIMLEDRDASVPRLPSNEEAAAASLSDLNYSSRNFFRDSPLRLSTHSRGGNNLQDYSGFDGSYAETRCYRDGFTKLLRASIEATEGLDAQTASVQSAEDRVAPIVHSPHDGSRGSGPGAFSASQSSTASDKFSDQLYGTCEVDRQD